MLFLLSASAGFASQPGFACGTRLQDICDGCTETGPGDSFFSFLTLDEFHSTWTQGGFDLVVDVRSAEAYADGHIPGAFNAPGLAGNGTADLSSYSNLADCSDKKVAVSGHTQPCCCPFAQAYSPSLPYLFRASRVTRPPLPPRDTGALPHWKPGARRRPPIAGPGLHAGVCPR